MNDEELFARIAADSAAESPLWASALRPEVERELEPVFSPLVLERLYALVCETIYEGYLLHYGRTRLFAPPDDDIGLLLGDALLAHGLVRIADTGSVAAVADLAALLSLCAQGRADERDGDGVAWAATSALLGLGGLDDARAALREGGNPAPLEELARSAAGADTVDAALLAHEARFRAIV